MDPKLRNNIKKAIEEELIHRLLIKYFKEKGFSESFDSPVYPPSIYDLPYRIPELISAVEVVPFVDKMDPITGSVSVGWNLFVAGINRMHLGTSVHANLVEFRNSLMNNNPVKKPSGDLKKTPSSIIEFITGIVKRNRDIITDVPQSANMPQITSILQPMGLNKPRVGPSMPGSWYEKNRPN